MGTRSIPPLLPSRALGRTRSWCSSVPATTRPGRLPSAAGNPEIPVFVSRPGAITTLDGTTSPGFPVSFLLSAQLRRRMDATQQVGPWWWIYPSPGQVQLVACAERTGVGDQVGDCEYPGSRPVSFPLYRATYEVVLYEARTREEVTRITLAGEGRYCPKLFTYFESQGARIFTTLTADQYVDAFRRFVEGRAMSSRAALTGSTQARLG